MIPQFPITPPFLRVDLVMDLGQSRSDHPGDGEEGIPRDGREGIHHRARGSGLIAELGVLVRPALLSTEITAE